MNLEKKQKLNDDIRDGQPMSWTKIKTLGPSSQILTYTQVWVFYKIPRWLSESQVWETAYRKICHLPKHLGCHQAIGSCRGSEFIWKLSPPPCPRPVIPFRYSKAAVAWNHRPKDPPHSPSFLSPTSTLPVLHRKPDSINIHYLCSKPWK